MAALAQVSIDGTYYATYTRLSGLLCGAALAFWYAPYRIRGVPGRGARMALDACGVAGLIVLGWSFHAFVAEQPGTYVISASSGSLAATVSIVVTPRNAEREVKLVGRVPFKEFQGAEEWIIGNYAYYSTIADRFMVYDISDPAHPKRILTVRGVGYKLAGED